MNDNIKSLNVKRGDRFLKLPLLDQVYDLSLKKLCYELSKQFQEQITFSKTKIEITKVDNLKDFEFVSEFVLEGSDHLFIIMDRDFYSLMTEFLLGGRGKYGLSKDHAGGTKVDFLLLNALHQTLEKVLDEVFRTKLKKGIQFKKAEGKDSIIWPVPPERVLRLDQFTLEINGEMGSFSFLLPETVLISL